MLNKDLTVTGSLNIYKHPTARYRLDPDRIETMEDVRAVFRVLGLGYTAYSVREDRVRQHDAGHLFVPAESEGEGA